MLAALVVLGLVSLSGLVITTWWPFPMGHVERLGAGILVGQLLYSMVAYAVAFLAGLTAVHVLLALGLSLAPLVAIRRVSWAWNARTGANLLALALLLGAFFQGTVFERVPPRETTPAIFTNCESGLADLPVHAQFYGSFAWGANYPPRDPELADERMAYPFLSDFEAASLWPLGLGLSATFPVQGLVLSFALCCLLYSWTLAFTERRSAALLTPWLAVFSGGLGGLWMFTAPGSLADHLRLSATYGGDLWFGNVLTQYLMNQRSFLFGLPIATLVVTLWWQARTFDARARRAAMVVAALLTACCPFAHTYSLVVLVGAAVLECLCLPDWSAWGLYLGVTLLLSFPQMLWFMGIQVGTFYAWRPGWEATTGWVPFWLDNLGLFIPLLLVALWRRGDARRRRFYLPLGLCFVAANLFRLTPLLLDNMKVFYPWFVFSLPWVADLVTSVRGPLRLALGLALCLSGGMDVLGTVAGFRTTQVFTSVAVRQAQSLRAVVPPHAVVLRGLYNESPARLAGLLAVDGLMVRTRGTLDEQRRADIRAIYEGRPEAPALLRKYDIQYIWVSPQERGAYHVNDAWMARWPRVLSEDGGVLYQIRMPPSPPSMNS